MTVLAGVATNCLRAYCEFNEQQGATSSPPYLAARQYLEEHSAEDVSTELGGVTELRQEELLDSGGLDFERFAANRHSIRNFSRQEVDLAVIERAVAIAQRSPSVCNRQSARVHLVSSQDLIRRCLSAQQGARGFEDSVNCLLICSADCRRMTSVGERNQCWVDGGMHAMSLVYALHGLGLGTCCLNWSKSCRADKSLRREVAIPESEVITLLIAVGHLPDTVRVPHSARLAVEDVLTVH